MLFSIKLKNILEINGVLTKKEGYYDMYFKHCIFHCIKSERKKETKYEVNV